MKAKRALLIVFLTFISINCFSSSYDSLFFDDLKKFFFKEVGFELKGNFYTEWKKKDGPYIILFASPINRVKSSRYNNNRGRTEDFEHQNEMEYNEKYFSFFNYKTYGEASCELSTGLVSYNKEEQCFTVFHELMHNLSRQLHLSLPYDYEEALADVIGNYGSVLFARLTNKVDSVIVMKQIKINEELYKGFNYYIEMINNNPDNYKFYLYSCQALVNTLLETAGTFQHDRFNYEVNTAYLLKNSNYCKQYFYLKDMLLKQKSIFDFLELIKKEYQETFTQSEKPIQVPDTALNLPTPEWYNMINGWK